MASGSAAFVKDSHKAASLQQRGGLKAEELRERSCKRGATRKELRERSAAVSELRVSESQLTSLSNPSLMLAGSSLSSQTCSLRRRTWRSDLQLQQHGDPHVSISRSSQIADSTKTNKAHTQTSPNLFYSDDRL